MQGIGTARATGAHAGTLGMATLGESVKDVARGLEEAAGCRVPSAVGRTPSY